MASTEPNPLLPRLWCDFNARGWWGGAADDCYYAFDQQALATLQPQEGLRVFLYDEDGDDEIFGWEGTLERYECGWRFRPDERKPLSRADAGLSS